jgi:hypothetical protein
MNDAGHPVTVTLTLTHRMTDMLHHTSAENLAQDQPDRFEEHDGTANQVDLIGGTMMWCDTAADAVLLLAYERGSGRTAALLWDLRNANSGNSAEGNYVVLTSRPWRVSDQ